MKGRAKMNPYMDKKKIMTLQAKGGMMLFTIQKPGRVYKGLVLLSSIQDNHQKRAVYIKEYKTNDAGIRGGGQNETDCQDA